MVFDLNCLIAACYLQLNNPAIAQKYAQSSINVKGDYRHCAFFLKGNAQYIQGDLVNAKISYEKAIELKANLEFYNNYAVVKHELDSSEDLCEDLKKASDGGIYINYHYYVKQCGYSKTSERCNYCFGDGYTTDGSRNWTNDGYARRNGMYKFRLLR